MGIEPGEKFGQRLAHFIAERYRTNTAFGEAVGMSVQAVGNLIHGDRLPRTSTLLRIAESGVNLHWLITGEGPMMASDAGKGAAQVLGAFKTWADSLSPEEFVEKLKEGGFGEEPGAVKPQTGSKRDD